MTQRPTPRDPRALPPHIAGDTVQILARTLWGEARGETVAGREAVACVILNRARVAEQRGGYWWGDTVEGVCLKPWQFSCWNPNDPNREKLLAVDETNRAFRSCLRIARRALGGEIDDPTGGATHYHTDSVAPPWSKGRESCARVGRHVFYAGVG